VFFFFFFFEKKYNFIMFTNDVKADMHDANLRKTPKQNYGSKAFSKHYVLLTFFVPDSTSFLKMT